MAEVTDNKALADFLEREMPEGTVIGSPRYWARRISCFLDALSPQADKARGEVRYFAADPAESGFDTFSTLEVAKARADELLEWAADAAADSGWADDPPQICYGVILGHCVEEIREPAPEGSEFTEIVNFRIESTTTPQPQGDGFTAADMTDARAIELLRAMRDDGGIVDDAEWIAAVDHAIAALSAQPQPLSAEGRFEQFVQAEIARSPEPLRELGEYLGRVLDEDQFPAANRLLLQLATLTPKASAPVGVDGLRRMVEKLAAHIRPTCCELWEEAQAAIAQQPAAVDESLITELRGHEVERLLLKYAAQNSKNSPRMAQMMELGARAVHALAQPQGEG